MCIVFKLFSFQRLTVKTKVSDVKGKELPALDVLSHAIKYLKISHAK